MMSQLTKHLEKIFITDKLHQESDIFIKSLLNLLNLDLDLY